MTDSSLCCHQEVEPPPVKLNTTEPQRCKAGTNEWEREYDGLGRRLALEKDRGPENRGTFLEKEGWDGVGSERRRADWSREWTHAERDIDSAETN